MTGVVRREMEIESWKHSQPEVTNPQAAQGDTVPGRASHCDYLTAAVQD